MATSPDLDTNVTVDAEPALRALALAQKELKTRVKLGLQRGGEVAVLPRVREVAPSIVKPWLTIKSTQTRVYVTTRGPRVQDRITGLLNFGGDVKTTILPTKKSAIYIPGSFSPIAAVRSPRHYTAKRFIETGVAAAMPSVESTMASQVLDSFGGLRER